MKRIVNSMNFLRSLFRKSTRHAEGPGWTARHIGHFRASHAEPALTDEERLITDRFHDIYYSKLDAGRGLHTIVLSWMGHEMLKCPLDLWLYQELLWSISQT